MKLLPVWYKGEIVAHAQMDDEDHEWASKYRWSRRLDGKMIYAQRSLGRGSISLHAEIGKRLGWKNYSCHINHCGLHCRRSNLVEGTNAQNSLDRSGPNRDSKSGVLGVSYDKARKRWKAAMQCGETECQSRHRTKERAIKARLTMEKKYGKGRYTTPPLSSPRGV